MTETTIHTEHKALLAALDQLPCDDDGNVQVSSQLYSAIVDALEAPSSADATRAEVLEALVREFIAYWTTGRGMRGDEVGCGMCGGLPHSTSCYVGRFDALLQREQGARP